MSLRRRLLLIIGTSLVMLWAAASIWMFIDLRGEFRATLDERLAASAHMVANLVNQLPTEYRSEQAGQADGLDIVPRQGVACEIRLLQGGLVARTNNSPVGLGGIDAGYSTRTIQGEQWRSYTLQKGGMRITTADRVERRRALLRDIVVAAAVPFLIAVSGSLLALLFGIRRGLAPLEAIRKVLAARQPGAPHPLPQARLPAELAPLVATINELLERMEDAIERERSFTSNAAHELRTPLTAVKTHIQVARMLCTGSDAAASLSQADEGVLRLQHTLDQLLMLGRVEGPFDFHIGQAVAASAIAGLAVQQVAPENRERVVIKGEAVVGQLAVPAVLAVTAVRNLLDNALRYSPASSPVTLSMEPSDGAVCFVVEDSGSGMSDSDRSHALQRFWRKGRGLGSGLGLSIVTAIVKRYGGAFALLPRREGGMSARVTLPLA